MTFSLNFKDNATHSLWLRYAFRGANVTYADVLNYRLVLPDKKAHCVTNAMAYATDFSDYFHFFMWCQNQNPLHNEIVWMLKEIRQKIRKWNLFSLHQQRKEFKCFVNTFFKWVSHCLNSKGNLNRLKILSFSFLETIKEKTTHFTYVTRH